MYQVIIIGAGPAGAYLAYLLSSQGIAVLLLEKEQLPRDKPCGGGITPRVIKLLDFDLNPVIEDAIHSMVITNRFTHPIKFTTAQPIAYMVSRERFDSFLVDKATRAGAEVRDGVRVDRINQAGDKVAVYSGGVEWQGEILVGADGAFGIVSRTLGLDRERLHFVTLDRQVAVSEERLRLNRGTVKIDFGLVPEGYAWVFPKAGCLSIGMGSMACRGDKLKVLLEAVIKEEGLERLPGTDSKRGWVIPLNPELNELHCGRALVVGDAAGLADSFTGEGIFAALYSSHLAAEIIAEQIKRPVPDLQGYTDRVKDKMEPELSGALRVTRWFYPVSYLAHKVLQRRPELFTEFIHLTAGDLTYEEFFEFSRRSLKEALNPFKF